jgi:hypothetical protein
MSSLQSVMARIGVLLASLCALSPTFAQAPPGGGPQVDWSSMPTVSPSNRPDDPMRDYYNATTIGEYYPLWSFHLWYNQDGTHVMFYFHKYPDGTTHMGAAQRYWRLVGKPGQYAMCIRTEADPKAKESCAPFVFHKYGDLWYQDYDRSASGDIPTYNNVHEVFTFVEGKR